MSQRLQKAFARLQEEPGTSPPGAVLRGLATGLSWGYGLGARARRWLYESGWRAAQQLPCGVISIGNLTVGGTGKTPLVACLARRLRDQGRRVAILSRGYGGRSKAVQVISDGEEILSRPPQAGDEPYLLAQQLAGVPVLTGANRYAAGLMAMERFHPDLILLDDGFQHLQLHRDLDLVLCDAARPFGNGRLLPRGPLREPTRVLHRPLILVLTRYQEERHREQYQRFRAAFPGHPVLRATLKPSRIWIYPAGQRLEPGSLQGRRCLAFAGLARPQVFAAGLEELGAIVSEFHSFPDHHNYDIKELNALVSRAQRVGASALITTEKDWVRLGESWEQALPLFVVGVEAEWLDSYMFRLGEHLIAFSSEHDGRE